MTVLVFGKTGQVARELARLNGDMLFLGRDQADLTDPETCAAVIHDLTPQAVINAAAWTDVDAAEANKTLANCINAEAPGAMGKATAALGVPFLHLSTDYVFDGRSGRAHKPSDPTAPLNAYGRTKLAGETAIRTSGARHIILRTSWVFSVHGRNFVTTMLRLADQHENLSIVDDQVGGPTAASDIAATLMELTDALAQGHNGGTYHYAGHPAISWAGFAREIFALSGNPVVVTPVPSSDYPTPAKRPMNSRLDCATLTAEFGIKPPDWKPALSRVIEELTA